MDGVQSELAAKKSPIKSGANPGPWARVTVTELPTTTFVCEILRPGVARPVTLSCIKEVARVWLGSELVPYFPISTKYGTLPRRERVSEDPLLAEHTDA